MTRLPAALAAAFALFAAVAFVDVRPARADATVDASSVENGYPTNLAFKLTASAPVNITEVRLAYSLKGRSSSAVADAERFDPARTVSVTVNIATNNSSSYFPPGSDFTYHWEITTADGATTVTPDQDFLYMPTGHIWSSVQSDFMTVYYYGDRKTLADTYLAAGVETYDRIGKQLLKTELEVVPVKVILFATEQELEQAKPGRGGTYDAATLTCGTKVTDDIVFVIPVSCGSKDPTDTLRHEFGHIINGTAGDGALAKLPSWLDEGTAVYAQADPGDGYTNAFLSALRGNRLFAFNQMGSLTNDASRVNLFYGQSYFMVRYLVNKAGPEKYAELFATIKAGTRFDQALEKVYGFDLAGFEQEFIASGGGTQAPRAVSPTTAPAQPTTAPRQAATATPSPTPQPAAASQRATSGGGDGREIGNDTVAIIGAAFVFLLLAAFALLLSMFFANNRKQGAPPGGPTAS